jgi:predicted RNA-binding protein YlxR (DUF448 family)
VDETGKLSGRGAYLHADLSCWELGLRKSLQKALKTEFSEGDLERLVLFHKSLMENDSQNAD